MQPQNYPMPFALTRQQINFFQTFGYLLLPKLYLPQIEQITQRFDQLLVEHSNSVIKHTHEAHYMKQRQVLLGLLERDDYLCQMLDDPRVNNAFCALLGDEYNFRSSHADVFTGDTYWHSDLYNALPNCQHIKFAMYLDPVDQNSGALRVIPGSHLFGDKFANMLEKYGWKHQENYGLSEDQMPSITLSSQPGDVILFDSLIKHATCNSQRPRRMLTIMSAQRFEPEVIPALKKQIEDYRKIAGFVYSDSMLKNAPPERMRHLSQTLRIAADI